MRIPKQSLDEKKRAGWWYCEAVAESDCPGLLDDALLEGQTCNVQTSRKCTDCDADGGDYKREKIHQRTQIDGGSHFFVSIHCHRPATVLVHRPPDEAKAQPFWQGDFPQDLLFCPEHAAVVRADYVKTGRILEEPSDAR